MKLTERQQRLKKAFYAFRSLPDMSQEDLELNLDGLLSWANSKKPYSDMYDENGIRYKGNHELKVMLTNWFGKTFIHDTDIHMFKLEDILTDQVKKYSRYYITDLTKDCIIDLCKKFKLEVYDE